VAVPKYNSIACALPAFIVRCRSAFAVQLKKVKARVLHLIYALAPQVDSQSLKGNTTRFWSKVVAKKYNAAQPLL
jgi:hypothetical protein